MELNMKEVLSLTTGLNSTYKCIVFVIVIDRKLTLEEGFQALFFKVATLTPEWDEFHSVYFALFLEYLQAVK